MIVNRPPANARQLDRCEVCSNKMDRSKLVRTQVEFLDVASENYFTYSYYDGTYWVVDTATDASTISYGTRCDNARISIADDLTTSYINGVQTWTGNGTMRIATIAPAITATSTVVFSAHVGPYERNTSPDMTVALGICNSDGSVKQVIKSYSLNTTTRVWFAETNQTLVNYGLGTDLQNYFYIQVTNDGNWWIDEIQLEVNPDNSVPGPFVKTSGTVVANTSDRELVTTRKVCPDCFETVLSKSQKYGRQKESPTAPPVDSHVQEF